MSVVGLSGSYGLHGCLFAYIGTKYWKYDERTSKPINGYDLDPSCVHRYILNICNYSVHK